ncbi:SNF2 family N-terminal domain-containing protein [Daedaleopsis nitida]|nr:SNF2 family N-terminal domain-containing protein [Daedaleopsis nitida]
MSADDSYSPMRPSGVVQAYVQVPRLSPSRKTKYRSIAEDVLASDEEYPQENVERVVGQVADRRGTSLYVRYTDGVIHKVPARSFRVAHGGLVQDYEDAMVTDGLPAFDPTSSDVHPSSRQDTLTVRFPGRMARSSSRVVDDSGSDELARDYVSDEFSDESYAQSQRRSTRAAATANGKMGDKLPCSPKKTRTSRHTIVVHGSDSDSEIQDITLPTRKSTRARKLVRSNLDDGDFEDVSPADDSDADMKVVKKKKVVRKKASRPAYGNFREVDDLLVDDEENEDIAALVAHRAICEKCHTAPTHEQMKRKKGRKRKAKDDDSEDEESRLANLGGWVRCLKCPVAAHWGCLAQTQRDEILRAAHERDKEEWRSTHSSEPEPRKCAGLGPFQTTEFICGSCMKGGICLGCKEVVLKRDQFADWTHPAASLNCAVPGSTDSAAETQVDSPELLFRCFTCKRLAHYIHLPVPDGYDPDETPAAELASYYQLETKWKCADCASYVYQVEHILAWRPYPEDAVEPPRDPNEYPNHKTMLPREYLIKWVDRSYRRVQWVPHGWLLAVAPNKLRNYLQGGSKIQLLCEAVVDEELANGLGESATFELVRDDVDGLQSRNEDEATSQPVANPEAEKKIPPAWRTVDRVLDIRLWRPQKLEKGRGKKTRVESSDDGDGDQVSAKIRDIARDHGEEPPSDKMVTIEEYEAVLKRKLNMRDAGQVAWAFLKWDDLGYDDASWDSPPRRREPGFTAYEKAFQRFLFARSVTVPSRNKKDPLPKKGDRWRATEAFTDESQPDLGQDPQLKLMPFQVVGVNWLCHNWHTNQNCILADEMGLGKTVQIVTFIGHLVSKSKSFPALVVVPNSTITNWVREFERWAPRLRVVPFYGEAKAREVIKRFELFHSHPARDTTGAKYHVLVTTYETVTNAKEFGPVFKSTPRWEMLVVDEGQRLKSDASLIFKRLKELNSFHRIIMTGTPLNNNIRELFNLMNFLDPDKWTDLEGLSKQYEELTDELVQDLHSRLKPYFLRRIKSEVLQLPPKNEVIVPVSMAPLQKEIYRSILSQNLEILRSLAEGNAASSKGHNAIKKTNMNNMLMQLRKCLQHPYLVSEDIEPKGMSPQETHERLVGASAKLRMLKLLLPKLRSRGHRVLLFSQFVIALDIVEDFLIGEGIKYLRLDGNTKQAERQKGMDEFNKADSDIFIYLLTTRAGGVGINLWSADTDLQAIARAHRYGQKKTVLVFKLMVKDSAEERIMQTGKKKLVLDHLIVQNMDDESGSKEDVQSILMFGAQALFEDNEASAAREVHYGKGGDEVELESSAGSLFAFAKVWSADKESLEDLPDEAPEHAEEADSWAKALELIAIRKATEQQKEATGRGVRRKAAAVFPQQSLDLGDTPTKDKNKQKPTKRRKSKDKSTGSDDSDFHAPLSEAGTESDGIEEVMMDTDDIQMLPVPGFGSSSPPPGGLIPKAKAKHQSTGIHVFSSGSRQSPQIAVEFCGLCAKTHAPGQCAMTDSPENLAQYRLMLMQHAGDEAIEERRAAIRVIDETLHRLGKIHLIYGQPLYLVEVPPQSRHPQVPKRPKLTANGPTAPVITGSAMPRNVTNGAQPVSGPSRINGAPPKAMSASLPTAARTHSPAVPRNSATANANAVAGSSKRLPPLDGSSRNPPVKKAKEVGGSTSQRTSCVVCGQGYHLVKDCPVVTRGPSSVTEAIQRLSRHNAQGPVVDILRNILTKMQRRALAASAASGPIDLSES